jgi:hypothetical protein
MIIIKNLKYLITFLMIFLFFLNFAFTQERKEFGTIKGIVYDRRSHNVLDAINIVVLETSCGAISDSMGKYIIDRVPLGLHSLRLSQIGNYHYTIDSVLVIANQTTSLDIFIPNQCDSLADKAIKDTTRGFVKIKVAGLMVISFPEEVMKIITKPYGFEYDYIGCVSSGCEEFYNEIAEKYLDNRNGEGWRKRLNERIREESREEKYHTLPNKALKLTE